jgi:hypothetical protein
MGIEKLSAKVQYLIDLEEIKKLQRKYQWVKPYDDKESSELS